MRNEEKPGRVTEEVNARVLLVSALALFGGGSGQNGERSRRGRASSSKSERERLGGDVGRRRSGVGGERCSWWAMISPSAIERSQSRMLRRSRSIRLTSSLEKVPDH